MTKKKLIIKRARVLRTLAKQYGVRLSLPQSVTIVKYGIEGLHKVLDQGANLRPIIKWYRCGCNDPQCGTIDLLSEIWEQIDKIE